MRNIKLNKKHVALMLALIIVVSQLFLALESVALPAGNTIHVHKLMYEGTLGPGQTITNDGTEQSIPAFAKPYDKAKYGDVGFTLYLLASTAYTVESDGSITPTVDINTIAQNPDTAPELTKIGTEVLVDGSGVAVLSDDDKAEKVYVVVETKTPKGMESTKAQPLLVPMPMYNETGMIDPVHVYPKSPSKSYKFELTKYGDETLLGGAVFDLYKGAPGAGTIVAENLKTQEGTGKLEIENLVIGKYYLVEKESANVALIENIGASGKEYILSEHAKNNADNKLTFEITAAGVNSAQLTGRLTNYSKPTVAKTLVNKPTAGEMAQFKADVKVPTDIADTTTSVVVNGESKTTVTNQYNKFIYKDTYSAALGPNATNVVVKHKATTLTEGVDYILTQGSQYFTIDFITNKTQPSQPSTSVKVRTAAGDTLTITYELKVASNATDTTEVKNSATLEFNKEGNETTTPGTGDTPDVVISFFKIDITKKEKSLLGTGKVLPGAKFIIENDKNQYLQDTATSSVVWGSRDTAKQFETAAGTGIATINGLPAGSYLLEEVVAPDGYKLPATPETEVVIVSENKAVTIENAPIKGLPVTGSDVLIITVALGVVAITAGYIINTKSRKMEK